MAEKNEKAAIGAPESGSAEEPLTDETMVSSRPGWREIFRQAFDKARREHQVMNRRELGRDRSRSLFLLAGAVIAVLIVFLGVFSSSNTARKSADARRAGAPDLGRRETPGQQSNDQKGSVTPLLNAQTGPPEAPGSQGVTPEDVRRTARPAQPAIGVYPKSSVMPAPKNVGPYALGKIDFSDTGGSQTALAPSNSSLQSASDDLRKPSLVFVRSAQSNPAIVGARVSTTALEESPVMLDLPAGTPRGSIQLSQSRDLPLLRQILRSEFVTNSQLFEFTQLNHHERSRNSFQWRMRRLVERELVLRQTLMAGTGDTVYSLARSAATLLQSMGEYCLVGRGERDPEKMNKNVLHAIGLNEIHLSALRAGLLVRWTGTMEIRSQNELTGFGFAKDYDAIVTLRTDIGERRFALEYERTLKPAKCYRAIASGMSREVHVQRLLYLVANFDILRFVSSFFTNTMYPVFFGLFSDWHSYLLETPVLDSLAKRAFPLRQALNGGAPKAADVQIATNYRLPFL